MAFHPIFANLVTSSWLEIIIVGIVAGLLLNAFLRGRGYGFIGNTLIGLFGAIIGGFIWDKLLKEHVKVDLGSVTIQLHLVLLALLGTGLIILLINFIGKRKQ